MLLSSLAEAGPASDTIRIAAVGDVMMGSDFPEPKLPAGRGRWLLAPAAPLFRKADLALANLEGPLTSAEDPAKEPKPGRRYLFRTPPSYAANLKEAGISLVSLANNHAMDFGREGYLATRRALDEAGVAHAGKGGRIAEFELRGVRIGVIALSYGPPPRSIVFPQQALKEIASASKRCDIVILSIHAGGEGRGRLHVTPGMEIFLEEERGDLIRFAHDAIEEGADLVIGHGPHVPRALELHRGRLIAYSLGNFATYGGVSVTGASGYAPLLTVELAPDGSFREGAIHSFLQRPLTGPRPDPKRRAQRLMQRLSAEDFPGSPLVIGPSGRITVRD